MPKNLCVVCFTPEFLSIRKLIKISTPVTEQNYQKYEICNFSRKFFIIWLRSSQSCDFAWQTFWNFRMWKLSLAILCLRMFLNSIFGRGRPYLTKNFLFDDFFVHPVSWQVKFKHEANSFERILWLVQKLSRNLNFNSYIFDTTSR